MPPITRSRPLHPTMWYIVNEAPKTTYHEEPLLHPRKPPHVSASHDLPLPHPKQAVFRSSQGPSGPPPGGPPKPPSIPPINSKPHVLTFYWTPPSPPHNWVRYYYDDSHLILQPKIQCLSFPLHDSDPSCHVVSHRMHPTIPCVLVSHSQHEVPPGVHVGNGSDSYPNDPPLQPYYSSSLHVVVPWWQVYTHLLEDHPHTYTHTGSPIPYYDSGYDESYCHAQASSLGKPWFRIHHGLQDSQARGVSDQNPPHIGPKITFDMRLYDQSYG